jgi:protocatechuate 3,4-dioxygenase beta subunit
MYAGAKMSRLQRPFECVVILAAVLARPSRADAGEIRGRILIGERPAPGVTVSAIPYEPPDVEARRLARGGEAPKPLAAAITRGDGTFAVALPAAPGGTVRLLAAGGGVVPSWMGGTYDATESDDLGEHVLARAETLAGRVVSATGAPVAGASVTVWPRGGPVGGDAEVAPAARTVVTGADGVFRSSEAGADGNRLTVVARSFASAIIPNVRAGAMPRPITLGLGAIASGVVLRSDRKAPAAGALVRFEAGGLETPWVEAGADGRFQLMDLPARAGTLVAEGGDAGLGEASTGPLPLPAGRVLTLVLEAPPTLEGLAIDTRARVPVARVRITAEDGTRTRTARTGPDGRYRIRGLLPQRPYRLRADEPRYTPYVRERVLLTTAETLRIDLPLTLAATLSGRVTDEGGRPVAGALGRIIPSAPGGMAARLGAWRTADRLVFRTGADGTFKAPRLAAGDDQRLTIAHPDYQPKTTGGLSLPPGSTKKVDVVLFRGLTLAGRVRDESGRPVADAEIELGSGRGFGARAARALGVGALATARPKASSGNDGKFEVKGLSEGDYSLTVSKAGFADHRLDRVPVDAGRRDPLDITLAAGAGIRGTVSRRDGRSAEGYWVRAVTAGGSEPGFGPFAPGADRRPTGADGGFSIAGLRAGETYDLVVLGPDGTGARREGVAAPAEDVDIVVPGPGRIAGRVIDAQTLSPLADFQVDFGPDRSSGRFGGGGGRAMVRVIRAVAGGGGAGPQAIHSEDGAFVLEDVPAGTWEVVAQAKGYQSARVGGVSVDEGGTREGVEVRLVPGNAIRGRVLDGAGGVPVLDAAVTLQRAGGGGRALAQLMGESDARTDGEGRFAIEGLAVGSYTVVAQHPDYADATAVVDVKEGPASAELRMLPGGTVGGVVLSLTSTPLAGAAVSLSAGAGGGRGRGGGFGGFAGGDTTVTDDAGRFRFRHVTAGRYTVSASLRGHGTTPADVILQVGESRENLVLSLASGTRIRGVVSGLPTALRASVRVFASGPDGYGAATSAAADGSFELTGAPAGPVDLRATAGDPTTGMRSASAQVEIAEGEDEAQAQIVFESGFSLSGTVTRNGQPVDGATVSASRGGGGPFTSARTSASGTYRLEGLSEGTYNVTVSAPGGPGAAPRPQSITINGDATLDLVIPFARLGGVVIDATTHQPLADVVVQATARTATRGPRGATTDSNGRFSLEDLEASPYTLVARKSGYQVETREVTPAESGGDDLVVELTRGTGIAIEVRDASFGVPLRSVLARATDGAGATVFAGMVALDSDGRGEIPSLPPGGYALAVYASGYAPAALAVTTPAPAVLLPLTVGGGIEIHAGPITLAHGSARAQILTSGGQPYPFSFGSPEGRLTLTVPIRRLENLAPGAYVLQVEGAEPRPFEVRADTLTTVVLP